MSIDACPNANDEELRLNITAYLDQVTALDALESLAAEAHRRARLTFEELITPEFRENALRRRSVADA